MFEASVLPSVIVITNELKGLAYKNQQSQRTSSVGEGPSDQQPKHCVNTTIDANVV